MPAFNWNRPCHRIRGRELENIKDPDVQDMFRRPYRPRPARDRAAERAETDHLVEQYRGERAPSGAAQQVSCPNCRHVGWLKRDTKPSATLRCTSCRKLLRVEECVGA